MRANINDRNNTRYNSAVGTRTTPTTGSRATGTTRAVQPTLTNRYVGAGTTGRTGSSAANTTNRARAVGSTGSTLNRAGAPTPTLGRTAARATTPILRSPGAAPGAPRISPSIKRRDLGYASDHYYSRNYPYNHYHDSYWDHYYPYGFFFGVGLSSLHYGWHHYNWGFHYGGYRYYNYPYYNPYTYFASYPYYGAYPYYPATYVYVDSAGLYTPTPSSADLVATSGGGGVAAPSVEVEVTRYVTLGDYHFKEGRYNDAAEYYLRALAHAPDDASLHFVLADALFALGDYHYAAFIIKKGLRIDPEMAKAEADKRAFYPDVAEFEKHMATIRAYIEDKPFDDAAQLVYAYNLKFSGEKELAIEAFRRTLELSPENEAAQLFLAALIKKDTLPAVVK